MHKTGSAITAMLSVVGLGVVGIIAGASVAAAGGEPTPPTPAGVSSSVDGAPAPQTAVNYAKNARGQSFGSALRASSPTQEPDLIQVQTSDGHVGYVKKVDLHAIDGDTVTSPAEALAYQAQRDRDKAAGVVRSIPVYTSDGVTVVGSFSLGG